MDKRILVVEDDASNQKVITLLLGTMGLACDVVSTGDTALAAVRDNCYSLVLMDIMLPGKNGFDVAREIRLGNMQTPYDVPIIALTALAMSGDKQRCFDAGMDDYLAKPFTKEEFTTSVRRWLTDAAIQARA